MTRFARLTIPGMAHHILQRGNRGQQTFFCDHDYLSYISYMRQGCEAFGVEIIAYCLMPNHVHLIAIPKTEQSLRYAIGQAHERYSKLINYRHDWRGYLWQGRFKSFLMKEDHLMNAVRYVELNPVRANIVKRAEDYRWSSTKAHLAGQDDQLVKFAPMLEIVSDWHEYLGQEVPELELAGFRKHSRTGRPLGDVGFIKHLESLTGRVLELKKPGPKIKEV